MSFSPLFSTFFIPISFSLNTFQLNTYRKFFRPKNLCFNYPDEDGKERKTGGGKQRPHLCSSVSIRG